MLQVWNRLIYLVVEYGSDVSAKCSTFTTDNDIDIAADWRTDSSSHTHHPDSDSCIKMQGRHLGGWESMDPFKDYEV